MTIVVAVVWIAVVVIPVDRHRTMRMMWNVRIPSVDGIGTVPSPTVVEAAVIPDGIIVVRAIVIVRPPPIVTHIDAYSPAGRAVVIPIQVGEEGVVVAPANVYIGVESADT